MRLLFQGHTGIKRHRRTEAVGRAERCAAPGRVDFMLASCVVKTRLAQHFEIYISSNDRNRSYDLVRLLSVLFYWHVVGKLSHTFLSKKSCDQNVCLRQIQLTDAHVRKLWPNLEVSSFLVIQ